MTEPNPSRLSTAAAVPARAIRIRTVPRAAVEALVTRLAAQGFRHIVTSEASPYVG